MADGVDVAELHALLGDEPEGPPGVALGRVGAGQGDDLGLRLPACLDVSGPGARPAPARGERPLLAAAPLQVAYGLLAHAVGLGGPRVDPAQVGEAALVHREQHARPPRVGNRAPAPRGDRQQLVALLQGQLDDVLRHAAPPPRTMVQLSPRHCMSNKYKT